VTWRRSAARAKPLVGAIDPGFDADYTYVFLHDKVTPMTGNALAKVRSFLVRGSAVVVVVLTYIVGGAVIQLASMVGVSTLALTTTATPAHAWYRRRFRRRVFAPYFAPYFVRRRYFPRRRYFARRRFFVPRRRFVRRGWWW
jgi:hypothetical protein